LSVRPGFALPGAIRPDQARELAGRAERAGCDALWVLDVRRDPFVLAAAAISATDQIPVGTNVAVAFARSPTVTAAAAWDLGLWSGGRFVLGLGSQVGPTLEARFGVKADHPAPRMVDYVSAVHSCWDALRSGQGSHDGDFYTIKRPFLQRAAEPDGPHIPIYVSAVNPVMAGAAGKCADGLAAHPFTTEGYLRETLLPALAAGSAAAGRPTPPVLLQLVVAPNRASAAAQMMAYTVPEYRRVLDHTDLGAEADKILAARGAGRRDEARDLVDELILDHLGVVFEDKLTAGIERWRPYADRLSLSVPWFGMTDREQLEAAHRLVDLVDALPGS